MPNKKSMEWKEEDGTKYKISFSEELQIKNLDAQKRTQNLLRASFYAKVILIGIFAIWFLVFLYVLYRLDQINFFTGILYR